MDDQNEHGNNLRRPTYVKRFSFLIIIIILSVTVYLFPNSWHGVFSQKNIL